VAPPSAIKPRFTQMAEKRAWVEAMRIRSQARVNPTPAATPFTAAMTGFVNPLNPESATGELQDGFPAVSPACPAARAA